MNKETEIRLKIQELSNQIAVKMKTESPERQRRFEISQRLIRSAFALSDSFAAAAERIREFNCAAKKLRRKRRPIKRLK